MLLKDEYLPAPINMGNLHYLKESMETALEFYERAFSKAPENPKVLLCLAWTYHELENYGSARRSYSTLKELDPDLTSRFGYLDQRGQEAGRAGDAGRTVGGLFAHLVIRRSAKKPVVAGFEGHQLELTDIGFA